MPKKNKYMSYEHLRDLRQNHAAWRLLRADYAPLAAAFFYQVFIGPKRRGIEAQELKTAGETLDALITGFDAENRTINVTLLEPFTLTEWEVVSINEGDTIRIGTEDIVIESLEYETENCDAYINGEYSLMQREDGLFTATDFDYPIMKEAKELTLAVPENLVFTEGIEPEFGEPLAEAVNLTAEEFFAALEAAEKGGVGFHSQNVRLTFGEDSGLVQVERYYAPWQ